MAQDPFIAATLLTEGTAQAELLVNELLARIESCLGRVLSEGDETPPGGPVNFDAYILGAAPTGAWSGQGGKIALYMNGWKFISPQEGMRVWVMDLDKVRIYDGAAWSDFGAGGGGVVGSHHIDLWTYGQSNFTNGTDQPFQWQVVGTGLPVYFQAYAQGGAGANTGVGMLIEATVPPGFNSTDHVLKIRVRARYITLPNTAATIAAFAYKNGAGANLVTTSAQNLGSAFAYFDFDLDESGLTEGDHLVLYLRILLNDTGGAGGGDAEISHALLRVEEAP